MKNILFITLFVSFGPYLFAQSENDWMAYPASDSSEKPVTDTVNFNVNAQGSVTVYEDERMDAIGQFLRRGEDDVEGVKIDGYRVLIFFDSDKSMAEQKKASFISAYPDHRTYVDYKAPNYRVRVGNFRTRLEAEALKTEIIEEYPTAIVVSDKIQLPRLEEEDGEQ